MLSELNKCSELPDFAEPIKTDDLEIGKAYKIMSLRSVKTKYGDKVVADLEVCDDTNEPEIRSYFLPNRMCTTTVIELVKKNNDSTDPMEEMYLLYNGRATNTYRSPLINITSKRGMEDNNKNKKIKK